MYQQNKVTQLIKYRLTTVMKVEMEIMASIIASLIGWAFDTGDNECRDI
jgi:F0F1-type ATP synthase delta subunit